MPKFFYNFFIAAAAAPSGAPPTPQIWGGHGAPYFYFVFTAADGGGFPSARWGHSKGGAQGAAPPKGEGNPAEDECFASFTELNLYFNYTFPIDLAQKGIPFDATLMEKV